MLTLDDMRRWSSLYDLLCNRVAIVNQLLGCRYDFAPDNPLQIRRGSVCAVMCDGSELCSFEPWDFSGLDAAFAKLDAWSDCVWRLSRAGRLVV